MQMWYSISKSDVDEALYKYFGLTGLAYPESTFDVNAYPANPYSPIFSAGKFYLFWQIERGYARYVWSNVDELYKNTDGTFSVKLSVYREDGYELSGQYEDKANWKTDGEVKKIAEYEAIIAPWDYNGKTTYRLILLSEIQ
jgi:hypothetical protein